MVHIPFKLQLFTQVYRVKSFGDEKLGTAESIYFVELSFSSLRERWCNDHARTTTKYQGVKP